MIKVAKLKICFYTNNLEKKKILRYFNDINATQFPSIFKLEKYFWNLKKIDIHNFCLLFEVFSTITHKTRSGSYLDVLIARAILLAY